MKNPKVTESNDFTKQPPVPPHPTLPAEAMAGHISTDPTPRVEEMVGPFGVVFGLLAIGADPVAL